MNTLAPIAQLDRALASGAKGCRFESCWAHHSTRLRLAASQFESSAGRAVSYESHVVLQPSDQLLDQLNLPGVIRRVAGDADDEVEAFGFAKRRDASTARDL